MLLHWLSHFFGLDNLSGPFYGFWSGVGSDIAELAIIGGVWKVLNCHEVGCWRLGTKVTMEENGHHYRRCSRCHKQRHPIFFEPTPPPSAPDPTPKAET